MAVHVESEHDSTRITLRQERSWKSWLALALGILLLLIWSSFWGFVSVSAIIELGLAWWVHAPVLACLGGLFLVFLLPIQWLGSGIVIVTHEFLRTEWRVFSLPVGRAAFNVSDVEDVYAEGDKKNVLWMKSGGKSKRILLMPDGSSVERPVEIIRYYLVREL